MFCSLRSDFNARSRLWDRHDTNQQGCTLEGTLSHVLFTPMISSPSVKKESPYTSVRGPHTSRYVTRWHRQYNRLGTDVQKTGTMDACRMSRHTEVTIFWRAGNCEIVVLKNKQKTKANPIQIWLLQHRFWGRGGGRGGGGGSVQESARWSKRQAVEKLLWHFQQRHNT